MDLRNLQFIFKPHYWLMNKPFSKEVDEIVIELMDKYELANCNDFTCQLGNATIWIANRPYASGSLYGTALENYRPSRLTIKRLLDKYYKIKDSVFKENVNNTRNKLLKSE